MFTRFLLFIHKRAKCIKPFLRFLYILGNPGLLCAMPLFLLDDLLRVIFDQWRKLHWCLDALSIQKILKGYHCIWNWGGSSYFISIGHVPDSVVPLRIWISVSSRYHLWELILSLKKTINTYRVRRKLRTLWDWAPSTSHYSRNHSFVQKSFCHFSSKKIWDKH